jgi:hypothetical protein
MTIAQADEARGRREGRFEVLIEMLDAKFGAVTEQTKLALSQKTDRELTAIIRNLLDARSLADLGL